MLAMYPGGISECEIFFPYGACATSSKVGQLAANHFASIIPTTAGRTASREVGRRALGGAQPIRIGEVDGSTPVIRGGTIVTAGVYAGLLSRQTAAGSARSKTTCRGRRQVRIG